MPSELENLAQLYGGPHDGAHRVVTARDLEYGTVTVLRRHPDPACYAVTTYAFAGRNARGQHRLVVQEHVRGTT